MDVVVLDYGAGNVASVLKAFTAVGANTTISRDAIELSGAEAIVVPGVGHFEQTTAILPETREAIREAVSQGVPLLGICLGLQWLFEESEEAPGIPGLGLVRGSCFRLPGEGLKVPHVGWNSILQTEQQSHLMAGLSGTTFAYFTHSFAAPVVPQTSGITTHGVRFSSVVESGLVFGVQFHPEKSGEAGLKMLANFLDVARG